MGRKSKWDLALIRICSVSDSAVNPEVMSVQWNIQVNSIQNRSCMTSPCCWNCSSETRFYSLRHWAVPTSASQEGQKPVPHLEAGHAHTWPFHSLSLYWYSWALPYKTNGYKLRNGNSGNHYTNPTWWLPHTIFLWKTINLRIKQINHRKSLPPSQLGQD